MGMILRLGSMGAMHACRRRLPALIATGVFIAIGIMRWPLAPVVLIAAPLSIATAWPRGRANAR